MAKVGLKETLSLLAAGYKKKDIEALAAIDEESEQEAPAPEVIKPEAPAPAEDKPEEPDYKKMYEDLLKKNQETETKITKLQQDNVHKDSAPSAAEAREKEQEALTELVRGFM